MNKKEEKDIALNLSILMSDIVNKNSNPEMVANTAITMCVQILKDYPKIKEELDNIMSVQEWDEMIGWFNFEKQYLR